jgi:hypothetical protein
LLNSLHSLDCGRLGGGMSIGPRQFVQRWRLSIRDAQRPRPSPARFHALRPPRKGSKDDRCSRRTRTRDELRGQTDFLTSHRHLGADTTNALIDPLHRIGPGQPAGGSGSDRVSGFFGPVPQAGVSGRFGPVHPPAGFAAGPVEAGRRRTSCHRTDSADRGSSGGRDPAIHAWISLLEAAQYRGTLRPGMRRYVGPSRAKLTRCAPQLP